MGPGLPASFQDQKAILENFAASCMDLVQGLVPLRRVDDFGLGGFCEAPTVAVEMAIVHSLMESFGVSREKSIWLSSWVRRSWYNRISMSSTLARLGRGAGWLFLVAMLLH